MADAKDLVVVLGRRDLDLLADLVAERIIGVLGAEPMLSTAQAAQLTGLKPGTLRKRVERGTLSALRVGKELRFRKSDLERMR